MRLGISSFTYGWGIGVPGFLPSERINELTLIKRAVEIGVDTLQIGDNLPLHELNEHRRYALRTALKESKLTLEIGARGLTPNHLFKYIELAEFFGAPLLRFVTDDEFTTPSSSEISDIILRSLPTLRRLNISIGIENHDRLKASEIASIMLQINDPLVGVCLDCVNSIGAGEGFNEVLNTLAPFTINLHLKDFTIRRLEHKMGFMVTGARTGTGMTDIRSIMQKLSAYGRCASAILEQWTEPESDIVSTIAKEEQWAREGIAFLKTLPEFNNTKYQSII